MKSSKLMCWVLGIGHSPNKHLSVEALEAIKQAEQVVCVLCNPRLVEHIQVLTKNLSYVTNDEIPLNQPQTLHINILEQLKFKLQTGLSTAFLYQGHPAFCNRSGRDIIAIAEKLGFQARMLPGISALDCLVADLGIDPCEYGLQIFDAIQLIINNYSLNSFTPAVIFQAHALSFNNDNYKLCGFKLLVNHIASTHGNEHEILLYRNTQESNLGYVVSRRRIYDLSYSELTADTTVFVPHSKKSLPSPEILKLFPSLVEDFSRNFAAELILKV